MLCREVLTDGQPIMVRVTNSRSGYGGLIATRDSGWGDNLHAVGLEDPLYDPDAATRPELELRALTIHHDYRLTKLQDYRNADTDAARQKILGHAANVPWVALLESNRKQNRDLAEMYDAYLALKTGAKTRTYHRSFTPDTLATGAQAVVEFPPEECDALAAVEHDRWLKGKLLPGESLLEARTRTENEYVRPFEELTDEQRRYNREFVRRIPLILALADYTIVAGAN